MKRWIFNIAAILSLLLMLATVGLWVDSLTITTTIEYGSSNTSYMLIQDDGRIVIGSGKPITFGWKVQRINPATLGPGTTNALDMGNGGIPHFLICIILAILPTVWLFRWNKRCKLQPKQIIVRFCDKCGDILTGDTPTACAECERAKYRRSDGRPRDPSFVVPTNPTRWCKQCQYPLNGVANDKCPECGKLFDPYNNETFLTDLQGRKLRKYWPWILVGCLLLLAIVAIGSRRLFGSYIVREVAIAVFIIGPMAVLMFGSARQQFKKRH